jgi:hypothetical protein
MDYTIGYNRCCVNSQVQCARPASALQAVGGALWEAELSYCDSHIQQDVRNNSAWSQRAFIRRHQATTTKTTLPGAPPPRAALVQAGLPLAVAQMVVQDLEYLATHIARAPRNAAAWAYLAGLFTLPGMPSNSMALFEEVGVHVCVCVLPRLCRLGES